MSKENQLFLEYINTQKREILEELYRITKPWLYKLIYRIIADKASADDIFQETWIQVLKSAKTYDFNKGLFNNFLYTIARNKAIKAKNFSSRYQKDSSDNTEEAQFGLDLLTPYKLLEIREKSDSIMCAIHKIEKNYQVVILLHYFAELEIKEISEHLNKPEGTIKTWLSRGRVQLQKKLTKSHGVNVAELLLTWIILLSLCFQRGEKWI